MVLFTQKVQSAAVNFISTLTFEERQKNRLKILLEGGKEAGIILERGDRLYCGDRLRSEDDQILEIRGAKEPLSRVHAQGRELALAAYHLANRHTACCILEESILYQTDPVLDAMIQNLGLKVEHVTEVFEPESGAYDHRH